MDKILAPGITKAGEGLDSISWNILGQTYVPKSVSENALSWHATFPPDTFVPPHIHPTQDEFIYMFEGQFELDARRARRITPIPATSCVCRWACRTGSSTSRAAP